MTKPIPVDKTIFLGNFIEQPRLLCRADGVIVKSITQIENKMYPFNVEFDDGDDGDYGPYGNFFYNMDDAHSNIRRRTPEELGTQQFSNNVKLDELIEAVEEIIKYIKEAKNEYSN